MKHAFVFDLYGTLFDTSSIASTCEKLYPGLGAQLSHLCREKQLQYTWLSSLMGKYINFDAVTRRAIKFVLNQQNLPHTDRTVEEFYSAYLNLEPFPEVPDVLKSLRKGNTLAILSNGTVKMIRAVLKRSSALSLFNKVISVDAVKAYKPSPRVYALASKVLRVPKRDILFVSSNPWDASGAKAFGLKVAWIRRNPRAAFDELGYRPDYVVTDLLELARSAG